MTTEDRAEERGVPPRYRALYERALAGKSRTACVKAFCLECQGWEDSAPRAVRDCASRGCPLWAVRPYRGKGVAT